MTQQTRDLLRTLAQAAVEAENRWRWIGFNENPAESMRLRRETRAACEALEQEIEPADILELLAAADREAQLRETLEPFAEFGRQLAEDDATPESTIVVAHCAAPGTHVFSRRVFTAKDFYAAETALSASPLPATPTPLVQWKSLDLDAGSETIVAEGLGWGFKCQITIARFGHVLYTDNKHFSVGSLEEAKRKAEELAQEVAK